MKKQGVSETNPDVGSLRQLLESKGWQVLKNNLMEQIKWCTDKALDPDDESMRQTVTLTNRELMLKWRKYNEILSKLPESIIAFYENNTPVEQPSDFDSYDKE